MWKFLVFLSLVGIYFASTGPHAEWPEETVHTAVFKILPMVCLVLVAWTSDDTNQDGGFETHQSFVIYGLLLSALGDICLVWRVLFKPGVFFFAIAQSCYSRGFGFTKPNLKLGAVCFVLGLSMATYFHAHIEDSPTTALVYIYAFLIITMAWRATDQYLQHRTTASRLGAIGAWSFVSSDFMLAADKWRPLVSSYAPLYIMLAYYVAQVAITASVALRRSTTPKKRL